MKILMIANRLPYPLDRGDRVRFFYVAQTLSKKHEITLLSFYQEETEKQYLEVLGRYFAHIHLVKQSKIKSWFRTFRGFVNSTPLQVAHFWEPRMLLKVQELCDKNKFDIAYAYHLRMAQYLQHLRNVYTILDLVDSISLFMRRMYRNRSFYFRPVLWLEWKLICKYERYITSFFDECWIVSEIDQRNVQGYKNARIQIIPNGIDFNKYSPQNQITDEELSLLFVGYMGTESVSAICYFVNDILPIIRKRFPSIKLYLVGANPPRKILKLSTDPNIEVTGFVESIVEYYQIATVVIAPMKFVAGMQNKIIEAMAMKKPVVTTSWGNEGINAKHGQEIYVGDTANEFAEHVIGLLKDRILRMRIGKSAARYAKKYRWSKVSERVDSVAIIIHEK
jgi:polysaccharide biosynthesis protein PslH